MRSLIIATFIMLSFTFGAVYAADAPLPTPVGRVVWVKGTLSALMENKETRTLQKDSVIYLHDTLQTDANTQAQIVFTDNSLMTFKPNTKFFISQYVYKPQQKKSVGKYVMNLLEGGFRTVTGLIAKNNPADYQVNTPVATIGVRGTDYAVNLQNGQLQMAYYAGSPCMTSTGGSLCLSATVQFGEVPGAGKAPVVLKTQPAVFKQQLPITPAKIPATFTSGASTTAPPSPNAAPAATTKGGITPKTPSGPVSSFCITQ